MKDHQVIEPGALAADVASIAKIDAVPTILEVICRATGLGFSAIARVTEDRWIACAVRDEIAFGLQPGVELQVETTICDEIRDSGKLVVIDQVAQDEVFCNHPTPKMYGFQSYISVPIYRTDGRFFGTLCAIDPRPAQLKTTQTIGMFNLFAQLIAFHLDTVERLTTGEQALQSERKTAELREQFIAVLGHDLRNPLASIDAGSRVLQQVSLEPQVVSVAGLIQRSVKRMAGLIENVLDFARGRLGGGISLRRLEQPAEPILQQVVAELRSAWPDRSIETHFTLNREVPCDAVRLAQLFSNLLANALLHGAPEAAVQVVAHTNLNFELSVSNQGEPIPPETLEQLFQPFSRASARPGQQGLRLGLYIASEIAHAHGGTLEVQSNPQATRFTFRMPLPIA